jgi:cyanophycinase
VPAPSGQPAPFEPAPQAAPGPIALVGSGEYLDVMIDVDRGLLAGRPQRAVFLPTASAEEGEERVGYWLELGHRHFERLGVDPVPLPVLTQDDAARDDFAALVAGAGLVYLSGGNPGYLANVLRDSLVWTAILAAWRAGAALAGCSAGACALSYVAEDMRAMRDIGTTRLVAPTGLATVPEIAVIPHFDRMARWAPDLTERYASRVPDGVTVVGVDEDTAIVTDGGAGERRFVVAGRRSAWVLHPGGDRTEYPSGTTRSLPAGDANLA